MSTTEEIRIDFLVKGTTLKGNVWTPPHEPLKCRTNVEEWRKMSVSERGEFLKDLVLEEYPEVGKIKSISVLREVPLHRGSGTLC